MHVCMEVSVCAGVHGNERGAEVHGDEHVCRGVWR